VALIFGAIFEQITVQLFDMIFGQRDIFAAKEQKVHLSIPELPIIDSVIEPSPALNEQVEAAEKFASLTPEISHALDAESHLQAIESSGQNTAQVKEPLI
jgi:division protein CdvB (Snf7/Vps24/ESCRT-III family)